MIEIIETSNCGQISLGISLKDQRKSFEIKTVRITGVRLSN